MTNRFNNNKNNKEPASSQAKQWLVILDELRQLNIGLKNRLVSELKQEVTRNFIETAEYYQQKFVDKDQMVRLLRHDITGLVEDSARMPEENLAWSERFYSLEKDMERLIAEFSRMKAGFEHYLSDKTNVKIPDA